eukprot:195691_1
MHALINFRLQAEQLNENENSEFLSNLIQSPYAANLITSAIFSHFSSKIIKSNSIDCTQITNITKIIEEIIHSRDYENEQYDVPSLNLDNLPPEMISCIGSFLQQNDYITLSFICRKTFIGTNKYNSLPQWISPSTNNSLTININNCKQLKHISINTSAKKCKEQNKNYESMKNILNTISSNPDCPLTNIVRFSTGSFGCDAKNAANNLILNQLLPKFNNLQQLDLTDIYGYRGPGADPPSLSSLKYLSLNRPEFRRGFSVIYNKFANCYKDQLIALCCNAWPDLKVYKFPKLKELIISTNSGDLLENINTYTKGLEILSIDMLHKNNYREREERDDWWNEYPLATQSREPWLKPNIINVFESQIKLRYFVINTNYGQLEELTKIFRCALQKTKRVKRDTINISMILHCTTSVKKFRLKDVATYLKEIMNECVNCKINNYMVSVQIIQKNGKFIVDAFTKQKKLLNSVSQFNKKKYLVKYYIGNNDVKGESKYLVYMTDIGFVLMIGICLLAGITGFCVCKQMKMIE